MISEPPLPAELSALFPDGGAGRTLSVSLPAGRTIVSDTGDGVQPVFWLSDSVVPADLWARLRAAHPRSGLWPLLLGSLSDEPDEFRPWADAEVFPAMSSPDDHDAAALLADWWHDHTEIQDGDDLAPAERLAVTAPFGQQWPGPAPAGQQTDADRRADEYAQKLASELPSMRLGLVAASRGADALSVVGWGGAANYVDDTAEISAVLRDWERRFGVRVVGVGFDTLYLSVAAPPTNRDDAQRIAAEHFAFCPDNVWQGTEPFTLAAYAEQLVDADAWTFWWD